MRSLLPELLLFSLFILAILNSSIQPTSRSMRHGATARLLPGLFRGCGVAIFLLLISIFYSGTTFSLNNYVLHTVPLVAIKLIILVSVLCILSASFDFVYKTHLPQVEYPAIVILASLFMLLLVSSNHLVGSFFSLLGFSLTLYLLILLDARTAACREAGLKYYYLSSFSSGLFVLGLFIFQLFAQTGNFTLIGQALWCVSPAVPVFTGLAFILMGLFFKISAFPAHLWAAEVYEGAPDPVVALFMVPVKLSVIALVLQLLSRAFAPLTFYWQPILVVASVGSIVWGCFGALSEKKTKRFFAYTSINQVGFMLLGASSGTVEGYRAVLIYMFLYATMSIGILYIYLCISRPDGERFLYLTDFRSLAQSWRLSVAAAILFLSMLGIPPLGGFFGKFYLLLGAEAAQLNFAVIIALATTLFSAYYYLRMLKISWFERPDPHLLQPTLLSKALFMLPSNKSMSVVLVVCESTVFCFALLSGPVMALVDEWVYVLAFPCLATAM